jgi:hypothetical protein
MANEGVAVPGVATVIRDARSAVQESAFLPPHRRNEQAAAPQLPHVHVEQHADGLSVWIGMAGDQQAIAVRAAALLDELRRNLRGPDRLVQVVCNGTAIYTAPRVHKETP